MAFLQSYCSFVDKHPWKILFFVVSIVMSLLTITTIIRPLPSFKDPMIGFEAKGTLISDRLNLWKLLMDETDSVISNLSLSGQVNKLYDPPPMANDSNPSSHSYPFILQEPPIIENSVQHLNSNYSKELIDETYSDLHQSLNFSHDNRPSLVHYSLGSSKSFCGKLYEGYTQIVISSSSKSSISGLLNIDSILSICELDQRLRLEHSTTDSKIFQKYCERYSLEDSNRLAPSTCCNSWSLPNYIACLNNKTSCFQVDSQSLSNFEELLQYCAPFYHKAPYEECFTNTVKEKVTSTSSSRPLDILNSYPYCGVIPQKCLSCDGWTYNVMHFLANQNFAKPRQSSNDIRRNSFVQNKKQLNSKHNSKTLHAPNYNDLNKLSYTNIFLPMAKSESLLDYYHALSKFSLKTPHAQVKAMDLGLKNSLFAQLISHDTKLFLIALAIVIIVISLFTWSMILSITVPLCQCLSLCLSYTVYTLVLDIPVFPFINLLSGIISIGICSDNAMLFYKHWNSNSQSETRSNEISQSTQLRNRSDGNKMTDNLEKMMKQAILGTFMATISTACSFTISSISNVIAVRCFCIFSTLSVLTNYLLIVILLPAALVARLPGTFNDQIGDDTLKLSPIIRIFEKIRLFICLVSKTYNRYVFMIICHYKSYLIMTFMIFLACSSILVFHNPTLQPSNSDEIQLLSTKHYFEQYDKNLKKQFAFENVNLGDTSGPSSSAETLPVRIVFGLKGISYENQLDPEDRGKILFDPTFDISDTNTQLWLYEFCQRLKQQRFIHQSPNLGFSNCFIDTFKSWMETRPCKDPIQKNIDRSPCCQAYEFPFSRSTFYRCIGEAIDIINKTPQFFTNPNSGVRFFKNTDKVAALIIEYQSNILFTESFTKMSRFFHDINDWVTWQINNTAPPSLKSGWFVSSNLELLALQTELDQSTSKSILLEILFAFMAFALSTRDFYLSLAGTLTIGTIIISTVGFLILLRWTLGVAESILVCLTIGLSLDFALHYSVAYRGSNRSRSGKLRIYRILEEVGSPVALGATTILLVGFVIVWSDILAYQELGVFLILIALISWITSTLFLNSMLATIDSYSKIVELTPGSLFVEPHL